MRGLLGLGVVVGALLAPALGGAERNFPLGGEITFKPLPDTNTIPERYKLGESKFPYELKQLRRLATTDTTVYTLTFPSPYKSPVPENNTVYAEYYVPDGPGPFPGVIVLDITGGDQTLSRLISTHFAQNKIAALFVQMAYYGPRRPKGSPERLMSPDLVKTTAAVTQTVQDLRWASAWLESRQEVDPKRLGIMGTSLGSFVAALTGEMEPRLRRVGVLLGGGGFVQGFYDRPEAWAFRLAYEALGGTRQKMVEAFAPIDPLTCAANLKQRNCLIVAGKLDEIVPPLMAELLWKASGEQKIVWYECTHYGAALYVGDVLENLTKHFGAP
jgi:cephalosporin-C deacetylase-like acetyl esterase